MRKIKIFTDSNYRLIEEQVNHWFACHAAAIIFNVLQSESYPSDADSRWSLTITIFYYEGEQGA